MNEERDRSAREYAEEQTAEFHVFEATITSTGEKVWQYWYTDDQGLNQHSLYYETKQEAIDAYIKFNGLQISAIIYSQADMDACAASKQQEIDRLVEALNGAYAEISYGMAMGSDDAFLTAKCNAALDIMRSVLPSKTKRSTRKTE